MRHNKSQYGEYDPSHRRTRNQWGNQNQWSRQGQGSQNSWPRSRWSSSNRDYEQQGYEPGFSSYRAGTSYYPGTGDRNYAMGSTHEERSQNFGRPFSDFDRYQGENYRPWSSSSETGLGREQYGRGPKGYHRSDERIREDVCEALSQDSMIDASEVEVQASEGVITLSGTVESRQMKRMIEDRVERVSGVKDVRNEIKIEPSYSSSASMSASSSSRYGSDVGTANKQGSKSSLGSSSSRHTQ